jgi:hypothetical protein
VNSLPADTEALDVTRRMRSMGTRIRAELTYLRILVPHYWKVVLAVVGIAITLVGIASGSTVGIVGALLFLAGLAATLSDVQDVRRHLRVLYVRPATADLAGIELTGGYEHFERILSPHGEAITDRTVNRWLSDLDDLLVEIEPIEYRPPKEVEWAHDLAAAAARRRGARDFNDVKVRLRTDLVPNDLPTLIGVQRTRFFYAQITNDLVSTEFVSREPGRKGIAAPAVALPDGRLPALRVSQCSNHVGVDTLAITRRGEIIVGTQTHANNQSPGLLAPSGSGSADWEDLAWARRQGYGFLGFVRRAMERELTEECGVPSDRVRGTILLGFARFLHRGGKPQFFGFTHLDVTVDDLRRTRHERRFVEAHHVETLDLTTADSTIASLRRFIEREGIRVSMPLKVGVEFLATRVGEDRAAFQHLRECAPDAVVVG